MYSAVVRAVGYCRSVFNFLIPSGGGGLQFLKYTFFPIIPEKTKTKQECYEYCCIYIRSVPSCLPSIEFPGLLARGILSFYLFFLIFFSRKRGKSGKRSSCSTITTPFFGVQREAKTADTKVPTLLLGLSVAEKSK